MTTHPQRTISSAEINSVLSKADELAKSDFEVLEFEFKDWESRLNFLMSDGCPVTYLPVTAVLLVARSMRDASELNVLHIQKQTSEFGYSAPSIGGPLITFAVQQQINLRSTSSQIMNNQPFTFKSYIEPDMSSAKFTNAYRQFFEGALIINELPSNEALRLLALIFSKCRFDAPPQLILEGFHQGRTTLNKLKSATVEFVTSNSESGKVGQAFVGALYDCAFPTSGVRMGNNNDPSIHVPGDVQASLDDKIWLWAEVKQKAVVSPDVKSFVDRVIKIGGDRADYFALANEPYPQNIQIQKVIDDASKHGVSLSIYVSSREAIEGYFERCEGNALSIANRFANSFNVRLHEANVTSELQQQWVEITKAL